MFGKTGEVHQFRHMSSTDPPQDLGCYYQVGVTLKGVFICLGTGDTWEKAFAGVKSVEER